MKRWIRPVVLLVGLLGGWTALAAASANGSATLEERLAAGGRQLERGEVDAAIQSLTLARDAAPADARVYALLGQAYSKQGVEPMAVLQFEKSIALDSLQTGVRLQLASLYAKNRRWQDAGREYQRVLRQDPVNDTAARELGGLYLKAKQAEPAVRILRPYLERHPDDEPLMQDYFGLLENAGRWDDLADAAGRALAMRAEWLPALRAAARANARLGRCDVALPQFLRWHAIEPLSAADAVQAGSCCLAQGNDTEAVAWFERALQPGAGVVQDWAEPAAAFMRMKRWEDAAVCYARKAAQDSVSVSALLNYALCKQQLKDYEASRIALRRAVAQKPELVKSHYYLATTYVLMDSTRAARREYGEVLRRAAGREPEFREELVQANRYLSVAHLMDRDWAPAVQALDTVLRYQPGDLEMRLYRAQALFALNRKAEARTDFESVLRQQPGNTAAKKGLDLLAQYN